MLLHQVFGFRVFLHKTVQFKQSRSLQMKEGTREVSRGINLVGGNVWQRKMTDVTVRGGWVDGGKCHCFTLKERNNGR